MSTTGKKKILRTHTPKKTPTIDLVPMTKLADDKKVIRKVVTKKTK